MAQLTELCHNSQIMPKQIPQDELDAILEAITQFPEGASVGDLSEALGIKLPRRTLQRRLARLVEQERLAIEGRAGAAATGSQKLQVNHMLPFLALK